MKNNIKQFEKFNEALKRRRYEESVLTTSMTLDGQPYSSAEYFGGYHKYFILSGIIKIPQEWDNPILNININETIDGDNANNPQFKLFLDGSHCATFDANHHHYHLTNTGVIKFELEIFSGNSPSKWPVFISAYNLFEDIEKVIFDINVFTDVLKVIDTNDLAYYKIYDGLRSGLAYIDVDCETVELREQISKASKEFEKIYQYESDVPVVHAVGHTHIDIAWLWTVRQAIEKAERSFVTILNLMDKYEDFTFIQSQPQLYEYIEQKNPALFERIKAAVKRGQWEVEGGMWVEADTTLVSGESLVRQFLYGKEYFLEKFGVDSKVLWLPDVFGYSASLPQIMKKSGIEYFMSTKLSWNQYNQIPFDTFNWKGIDGSEILTHFITTPGTTYKPRPWYTTYNGLLEAETISGSWDRYQQKNINKDLLVAYGYGDGGGGPTELMVETGRRLEKGIPGMPLLKQSTSKKYFDTLKDSLKDKTIPKWHGELYFEYHRGTYTSRAQNKKDNRRLENALQSLEKLSVMRETDIDNHKDMWKVLLLNQFHDIIPGTSIKEVYENTELEYQKLTKDIDYNLSNLIPKGDDITVFNPLSFGRSAIIDVMNNIVPEYSYCQSDIYGDTIIQVNNVEAMSLKSHRGVNLEIGLFEERPIEKEFETNYYKVKMNDNYEIISLFDIGSNRECINENGFFNKLTYYEDLPMDYDAWDLDAYYDYKKWDIESADKARIIADGPIRLTLEIQRSFSHSKISQQIHFYKKSKLIEFSNHVSWYENHKLLKVNFDLNINTSEASFDIPFGVIQRPIHNNTSWEEAQFEVNAQKWADVSESDYGFALLNDCKYGYHAKEQRLGLSLLRSSNEPFLHADHGEHYFKYALLPHDGDWKTAEIMKQSLEFNNPVQIHNDVLGIDQNTPIEYESNKVLLDTLKHSENGQGVIARFYEYTNSRTTVLLKFDKQVKKVSACDLMEQIEFDYVIENNQVSIEFSPFEIVSLRIEYDK